MLNQFSLRVAFDIIDTSREDSILKSEFAAFCRVAAKKTNLKRKLKEGEVRDEEEVKPLDNESDSVARDVHPEMPTSLQTHFFGRKGAHKLSFNEFSSFVFALQREVLKAEFMEYSRGLDKITERDFAQLLLRYTELSETVSALPLTF